MGIALGQVEKPSWLSIVDNALEIVRYDNRSIYERELIQKWLLSRYQNWRRFTDGSNPKHCIVTSAYVRRMCRNRRRSTRSPRPLRLCVQFDCLSRGILPDREMRRPWEATNQNAKKGRKGGRRTSSFQGQFRCLRMTQKTLASSLTPTVVTDVPIEHWPNATAWRSAIG